MSDGQHHRSFIDRFHAARVLCVGDLMLDRFVYGSVDRVSAEAPVPILRVGSQRAMLGGVGNVGRNVAALGAHAVLIAVTGDDAAGAEIAELAESQERLRPHLVVDTGRPSTLKTRYIADGQQLLRADEETTAWISPDTARRVIAAIRSELAWADVLVLSDYTKGVLTDEVLSVAIAEARAAGVPVVADPKREDFEAYAGAAMLTPNEAELAAAARRPCADDAEIEASALEALEHAGIGAMLVTRSERGMSLVRRGREPLHLSARALEVFDVSGAGDTVVATTAVALATGADPATAAELANVAGGVVVGKVGTAAVGRDELASGLLAVEVSSSEAKIVSAEAALEAVDRWRKRGDKIGFTNGCFDLLHPGHVALLTEAQAACDRLVVAVNCDESARRIKGPDRPIQNETARAIVLASLSMVDLVVVFSDENPTPLLDLLQPDVLVKGGNYTLDRVVGADVVRSYGGEVKITSLVPGHSASRVIARMSGPGPRQEPGPRRAPIWPFGPGGRFGSD